MKREEEIVNQAVKECGMKRTVINIIVFFAAIAFVVLVDYWTYKKAYIAGYKQAIKDEIEYIESQTDSIKGKIILLDRAIEKYRNYGMDKD